MRQLPRPDDPEECVAIEYRLPPVLINQMNRELATYNTTPQAVLTNALRRYLYRSRTKPLIQPSQRIVLGRFE